MNALNKTMAGMAMPRPVSQAQPDWALEASRRRNRGLVRDLAAAHALILELRMQLRDARGRAR